MRLDLDDAGFRREVAGWLRELDEDVICDLNAVFDRSPGVYPTTLVPLWREELARRQISARGPGSDSRADAADLLPVGHPVDADWRFTPDSVVDLVACATADLANGEPMAHVGTPSTFLRCVLAGGHHQHVLVDRNVRVLDALAARDVGPPHLMLGVDLRSIRRLHFRTSVPAQR